MPNRHSRKGVMIGRGMIINLGLPQIIYLTLMFLGLGIAIEQHGKPKEGIANFWVTLIATAISILLLAWGGFFAK